MGLHQRGRTVDPADWLAAAPKYPRDSGHGTAQSLGTICVVPAAGPADVAQLVERDLPKVDVASSSLVIRSTHHPRSEPLAAQAHARSALRPARMRPSRFAEAHRF